MRTLSVKIQLRANVKSHLASVQGVGNEAGRHWQQQQRSVQKVCCVVTTLSACIMIDLLQLARLAR